jgi:hypothetical protein
MRGRLEHQIRLLPQVLSCSFTENGVVVLVDPAADGRIMKRAVETILAEGDYRGGVTVIGPALTGPPSIKIAPLVATATVAAVAAVGVGALVGGLVAVEHPPSRPEVRPPAIVAAAGSDSLDILRELRARLGEFEPASIVVAGRKPSVLPPGAGIAAEAVSLPVALAHARHQQQQQQQTASSSAPSCDHRPPDRGAPWDPHGRHLGDGPAPWSHSVLVPPHCGGKSEA